MVKLAGCLLETPDLLVGASPHFLALALSLPYFYAVAFRLGLFKVQFADYFLELLDKKKFLGHSVLQALFALSGCVKLVRALNCLLGLLSQFGERLLSVVIEAVAETRLKVNLVLEFTITDVDELGVATALVQQSLKMPILFLKTVSEGQALVHRLVDAHQLISQMLQFT